MGRAQAVRGARGARARSSWSSTTSTGQSPTFLDLIEYVASFVHDAPLLVLCTARPDLFDVRPTWTAPKPSATLVTLRALSENDSETLVERLGDLPEHARERIVQAAEGNPLFVEQLVAMQAENGTTSSRCRRRSRLFSPRASTGS